MIHAAANVQKELEKTGKGLGSMSDQEKKDFSI